MDRCLCSSTRCMERVRTSFTEGWNTPGGWQTSEQMGATDTYACTNFVRQRQYSPGEDGGEEAQLQAVAVWGVTAAGPGGPVPPQAHIWYRGPRCPFSADRNRPAPSPVPFPSPCVSVATPPLLLSLYIT